MSAMVVLCRLGLIGLGGSLAGCALLPGRSEAPAPDTPVAAPQKAIPKPLSKPGLAVPEAIRPQFQASAPASPPTPAAAKLSVTQIVGLDTTAVRQRLGEPSESIDHPPARIWRYRKSNCVLVVRFFPNVNGEAYRALTVNAEGKEEKTDAADQCLNSSRDR